MCTLQAMLQGLSSKAAFHLLVCYVGDGKIAESTLYSAIRTFLDSQHHCSHNNHHAYYSWLILSVLV